MGLVKSLRCDEQAILKHVLERSGLDMFHVQSLVGVVWVRGRYKDNCPSMLVFRRWVVGGRTVVAVLSGRYAVRVLVEAVCCVGTTAGGQTSGFDRDRGPRILPEYAQFGTTVSGVEWPDCSVVATSSAQEGILVGWGGGCDETTVCVVEKRGGGCGTWLSPGGTALVRSCAVL